MSTAFSTSSSEYVYLLHFGNIGHEPPSREEVAERNEEPEPVANLGKGDHESSGARGGAETLGDVGQHRLGVVEVGDRETTRHGEQRHEGRRHRSASSPARHSSSLGA